MKMTFVALAAVATLAGSLATTPASAQRGLGAAVAGGIIGGAIVGGAIAASQPPAYAGPAYVAAPRRARRRAIGPASASGTVTPGASAASKSATDPTASLISKTRLRFQPGFSLPFSRQLFLISISGWRSSHAARLRSASSPPSAQPISGTHPERHASACRPCRRACPCKDQDG